MKTIPFKFELGETLKDILTGFHGVAVGRTQYFSGCNHYGLLSQTLGEKGKPQEWEWLDETRPISVEIEKITLQTEKPTSGPHPNAPKV